MLLIESNLYCANATSSVLAGKHIRRGMEAHLLTVQALFTLYLEAFTARNPNLRDTIQRSVDRLTSIYEETNSSERKRAFEEFQQILETDSVIKQMDAFDRSLEGKPTAKRTRHWELHLSSLDLVVKYFFALDKHNYAVMIPLYLADLERMQNKCPDVYSEF